MTVPLSEVVPVAHCFCCRHRPVHGLLPSAPESRPPKPPGPFGPPLDAPSSSPKSESNTPPHPEAMTSDTANVPKRKVRTTFMGGLLEDLMVGPEWISTLFHRFVSPRTRRPRTPVSIPLPKSMARFHRVRE